MTTQTLTLTNFLLARIAEDEQNATALAKELGRWGRERALNGPDGSQGSIAVTAIEGSASAPERVLTECEAKRRIVDLHQAVWAGDGPVTYNSRLEGQQWAYERGLRALALPYADHPDYDKAWRP